MAQFHDSMVTPRIEELLSKVDSRFTLVTLGAQRARQINAYFNQLGEGMGANVPPQVTSSARKPLSIAFEEISVDKIVPVRNEDIIEAAIEAAVLEEIVDEVAEEIAEEIVAELLEEIVEEVVAEVEAEEDSAGE